jgi:hypothetical protein
MYKHLPLITAGALFGLILGGSLLQAQTQEQRAQRHMRTSLGATVESGPQTAQQQEGVAIQDVRPDSPAARAGLRNGDVITRVGNRLVEDFNDLANAITRYQHGDRLNIRVQRGGQERTFSVTVGERAGDRMPRADEEQARDRSDRYARGQEYGADQIQRLQRMLQQLEGQFRGGDREQYGRWQEADRRRGGVAFLGVQTREWTPDASDRPGARADRGVVVTDVDPDSPAAEAGLRRGDVITGVDGRNIATPQELRQRVRQAGASQEITVTVLRGNRQQEIRAHLDGALGDADQSRQVQRLQRRLEQMEDQFRGGDRQDRFGRRQGDFADQDYDMARLHRRLQQLEDQFRDRDQDRYGRWQEDSADRSRDMQRLHRRLQQLEDQIRDLNQQERFGRRQGDFADQGLDFQVLQRRLQQLEDQLGERQDRFGRRQGDFADQGRELARLLRRLQQLEDQLRDQPDRYGRRQGDADQSREVQRLQRQLQQLEDQLRNREQNR